jgi:hypothetical protein
MTTAQADAINKKYKDMETELNALKATIRIQQDTITKQHVVIQTQLDTITKQHVVIQTQLDTIIRKDVIIKTQIDTITKYNERVVYIEVNKDSISRQYDNLADSLWKWALGPTLIYTQWPDNNAVYLMDLSEYYMATDDFGIIMVKMSTKEYTKYLTFKQLYGLPESAFWQFRTEMNIKRLKKPSMDGRKVWKYKTQWNKPVTP